MSLSTIGADDAAAYGPPTTSPARIWADHIPAKFVAKTEGRRLTHARPDSTASWSTTSGSCSPSARELRNTAEAPGSASVAEPTTWARDGNPAVFGVRVTART